jgi:hypothetical protein
MAIEERGTCELFFEVHGPLCFVNFLCSGFLSREDREGTQNWGPVDGLSGDGN